jgi:membrane protein implicated in regulation of membrane protease activity
LTGGRHFLEFSEVRPLHNLILFLPLLALGLFFVFRWQIALILYIPILLGSLAGFLKVLHAQRQPRMTAEEAMVGAVAVVIEVRKGEALVEYQGEIWRAASTVPLHPHDKVLIEAVNGLRLTVVPRPASLSSENESPQTCCFKGKHAP